MSRKDKPQIEDLWKNASISIKIFLIISLVAFLGFSSSIKTNPQSIDREKIFVIIKDKKSGVEFIDSLSKLKDTQEVSVKKGIFIKGEYLCFSKSKSETEGYITCKYPDTFGTIETINEYALRDTPNGNTYQSSIVPIAALQYFIMTLLWLFLIAVPTYLYLVKNKEKETP